jgi:hypothetical protein
MVTKKDRRKSGYVTPRAVISKKELIRYDLVIDPFYDEWDNYRDGFRDWYRDFKTIKKINRSVKFFNEGYYNKRIKMNLKQRILLRRRKKRKHKQKMIKL